MLSFLAYSRLLLKWSHLLSPVHQFFPVINHSPQCLSPQKQKYLTMHPSPTSTPVICSLLSRLDVSCLFPILSWIISNQTFVPTMSPKQTSQDHYWHPCCYVSNYYFPLCTGILMFIRPIRSLTIPLRPQAFLGFLSLYWLLLSPLCCSS